MWTKIDLLPQAQRPPRTIGARTNGAVGAPAVVSVSALTGEGLAELAEAIERHVAGGRRTYAVALAGAALAGLHRLYELGEVVERHDTAAGETAVRVRVAAEREAEFRRAFPDAAVVEQG